MYSFFYELVLLMIILFFILYGCYFLKVFLFIWEVYLAFRLELLKYT